MSLRPNASLAVFQLLYKKQFALGKNSCNSRLWSGILLAFGTKYQKTTPRHLMEIKALYNTITKLKTTLTYGFTKVIQVEERGASFTHSLYKCGWTNLKVPVSKVMFSDTLRNH